MPSKRAVPETTWPALPVRECPDATDIRFDRDPFNRFRNEAAYRFAERILKGKLPPDRERNRIIGIASAKRSIEGDAGFYNPNQLLDRPHAFKTTRRARQTYRFRSTGVAARM